MGQLVNGKWQIENVLADKDGSFKRKESSFRNFIKKGTKFQPEKNRYLLYVSLACPWASRALIMRKLKGLDDIISIAIVSPIMGQNGWSFDDYKGATKDPLINAKYLKDIYIKADNNYTGKVTVPLLYDLKENTIVNNESSDIMRMFNSSFNEIGGNKKDFYPQSLREKIDEINEIIYENVNNGVYKAGFAIKQEVYEEEVKKLFKTLDFLENKLENKKFLFGDIFTESDIRLFVSLIRFDPVYFGNFKCNIRQLKDYKNLWEYTKRIYNMEGVKETVNFDHIKNHYYRSHPSINPNGIVPLGPLEDLNL